MATFLFKLQEVKNVNFSELWQVDRSLFKMCLSTINDLPAEMLCELFKYLHSNDLFSCSLVNKRWRSLVFSLERLTVSVMPSKFNLNRINLFTELVRLKITTLRPTNKKVNLSFPKLKVLLLYCHPLSLCIDAPKLSVLVVHGNTTRLTIKHPESIRKLEADFEEEKLWQFKNVEYLGIRRGSLYSKKMLELLPKLKELHCNLLPIYFVTLEKLMLSKFLNDVVALKGLDFRFIYSGFRLTIENVAEFYFGPQERTRRFFVPEDPEELLIRNHRMLDPAGSLDYIEHLNYNRLVNNEHGQIPAWVFPKLTGVKRIFVDEPLQDVDQFVGIFKSLPSINTVVFKTAAPKPAFKEFDLPQQSDQLFDYLSKFK